METVIRERLFMQGPDSTMTGFYKFLPERDKCTDVVRVMLKNSGTLVKQIVYR
jgi:hypothetical protein